jgi:hypothetical protein
MPGILCVGATVTNTANDKQYTIVAGDTFASLTGPLGAPDVGTLLPTLEVVTGAGLLQPGVALALGRVSRTPSAQDSLTTLAASFDTDPASVAIANQDAASIFVPGTVFTLTSKAAYTVKGPETLAQVATALGTTTTGFATDPDVVRRSGIYQPIHDAARPPAAAGLLAVDGEGPARRRHPVRVVPVRDERRRQLQEPLPGPRLRRR